MRVVVLGNGFISRFIRESFYGKSNVFILTKKVNQYDKPGELSKYLKLNEIFKRNVHNAYTKEKFSKNDIELISPDSLELNNIIQEAIKYFSNNHQIVNYDKQRLFWKSYEKLYED